MRGYTKIKEKIPFSQQSETKTEYPFLDQDFSDYLNIHSSKTQENEQKHDVINVDKYKRNDIFLANSEGYEGERNDEGVLRRNFTISSPITSSLGHQKNGISSSNLERQSSKKAIQKVKRAFSMSRSASINSDRYCRIYDQPMIVKDCDHKYEYNHVYNYDYGNNGSSNHHQHDDDNDDDDNDDNDEYDSEGSGSMETRYMGLKKKKNKDDDDGKKKVGSKVVKACKRMFSR